MKAQAGAICAVKEQKKTPHPDFSIRIETVHKRGCDDNPWHLLVLASQSDGWDGKRELQSIFLPPTCVNENKRPLWMGLGATWSRGKVSLPMELDEI